MTDKLIVEALSKEINALISIIAIVRNNKDGYIYLEYNDGHSHLFIPKGYFDNVKLKRESQPKLKRKPNLGGITLRWSFGDLS